MKKMADTFCAVYDNSEAWEQASGNEKQPPAKRVKLHFNVDFTCDNGTVIPQGTELEVGLYPSSEGASYEYSGKIQNPYKKNGKKFQVRAKKVEEPSPINIDDAGVVDL
jgi:hypothetical protein